MALCDCRLNWADLTDAISLANSRLIHVRSRNVALLVVVNLLAASLLAGDAPWASLIPFKKVDADPKKSYEITEQHGPWVILAANFAGPKAETQAKELVLELRSRYKLSAYVHHRLFDFSQATEGSLLNARGEKAKMRYANAQKYDAIAVLVGDFRSVDDADLEKTVERLKYLKPECLDIRKHQDSNQRFVGLRDAFRRMQGDPEKNQKGPMGNAFATRNPLLPDEYFTATGVDAFVEKMNRGVANGLLDNPGKFTVRVATFRGNTSINQREIDEIERENKLTDKLAMAADKAHRLTVALRKRGVEAYEFHDRTESTVSVGSFESEGQPLPSGAVEINPAMYKIIEQYRAVQTKLPGKGMQGMQPKALEGIAFDVQPVPTAVPKRSIAADYARRKSY